jgi:ParB family chromosome partitioning protein
MSEEIPTTPLETVTEKSPTTADRIEMVDINNLTPNPDQPRQHFDTTVINELAASLKELGFINPITVREGSDGLKIIIAGEQRFRAAKLAGLLQVPCIIKNGNNAAEIALAENMLRQNLTAIEESEALARLVSQGFSQKTLCQKFSKAASTISELIAIAGLPDDIKAQCRNNHEYARRELKKIASAPSELQSAMFDAYKKKMASSIRTPNKNERSVAASLKTVVKTLGSRLDTFEQIEASVEKEGIREELQQIRDKINVLLA